MKKIAFTAIMILTAIVFIGCTVVPKIEVLPGADKLKEELEIAEVEENILEKKEETPINVSLLAKEDFLTPVEDYSWEREYKPEYVVIHFTSAVVLSKEEPYNMETVRGIFEDNGLSIHYIIDRDGNILCYMPEDRAAWHAGKGTYADDERLTNLMNKYSIGIELLAIGSEKDMAQYLTPAEYNALDGSLIGFTDEQYDALGRLIKDICERNSIPFDSEHIIGHDMYNPQKNDPGELFDWDKLFEN
jgi:N-acetyl-anhydromuramyl-L-alanine amidase AmpD